MAQRPAIREFLLHAGTLLLTAILLTLALELWRADLSIPFSDSRDSLYNAAVIKGEADNGSWFLRNRFVGAPDGLEFHDHLGAYGLFHVALKLLLLVTGDHGSAMNLFFLGGFLAVASACLAALRRLGLSPAPAVGASVLFTFLPYHFMRGEEHLFVGAYVAVPLLATLALLVLRVEPPPKATPAGPASTAPWRRAVGAAAVCLVAASAGVYHSFFGALLIAAAGVFAAARTRSFRPPLVAALLVGTIVAGLAANLAPTIAYRRAHGDTRAFARTPATAERFALRVPQLVLPISAHRIPLFQWTKARYNAGAEIEEGDSTSLGLLACGGFLLLLGLPFARLLGRARDGLAADPLVTDLALLNLTVLLVATAGGFSPLVALWLTPQIRAYNRTSVYIAFFALAALVALWDRAARRSTSKRRGILLGAGLATAVILGLLDQTSPEFAPPYEAIRDRTFQQRRFIAAVEATLPEEAMVFQLPYLPFPEGGALNRMSDYDHFAWGYLASKRLRWSYGAMRGRGSDAWLRDIAARPPRALAESLALAGFDGLLIDRFGYDDAVAAALDAQLRETVGDPALVSDGGRHTFFDLRPFRRAQEGALDDGSRAARDVSLNPLLINWRSGFYDPESAEGKVWRWGEAEGEFDLVNPTHTVRRATMEATFRTRSDGPARLIVESPLVSEDLRVEGAGLSYRRTLTVPPGTHRFRLRCDAPRVDAPRDWRSLVFQIVDLSLTEPPAPAP